MDFSSEPLLTQKRDSFETTSEESASCFARWTFRWLNDVFDTGYSRQLRFEDMPPLTTKEATAPIIARFSSALQRERARLRQHSADAPARSAQQQTDGAKGAPALRRVFCAQFGPQYYPLALYKLTVDALGFAGPLLLKLIVDTMQSSRDAAHAGATATHCYVYAAALGICVIAAALLSSRYNLLVQRVALQLRTALVGAVYEHALCVPLGAVALGDDVRGKDEDEDTERGSSDGSEAAVEVTEGGREGASNGQNRGEGEADAVGSSSDSAGKIVNLMSVDTQRLVDVVSSLLELVSMPFYMCAAFWLLYRDLSFAFVGGLAVVLVIIPLNMRVAVAIGAQTTSLMQNRDARMLLCTEFLRAVNVLKALGWQHAQGRCIGEARRAELRSLRTMKFLDAVCVFLWASTPVLVTLATFAMVVRLLSNAEASSALSAGDVFAAVTLLNMLIYPMNALPWVIKGVMEGRVSAERLERFLLYTGQKPCVYRWLQARSQLQDDPKAEAVGDEYQRSNDRHGERGAIFDTAGRSFWWHDTVGQRHSHTGVVRMPRQGLFCLHEVHLGLYKRGTEQGTTLATSQKTLSARHNCFGGGGGKIIAVIGAVGSGKSSLLQALLGELAFADSDSRPNAVLLDDARVGYVAQRPWLQAGTIRENILFGTQYDHERYTRVLHACALDSDLKALSNGDMTLVGERGVTLSGGQRQRLALARCAYACRGARAYVLDDVLSAVDATTAEHLWKHCVGPAGMLANSFADNGADSGAAVVLVTHALHFLPRLRPTDVVVHLVDGKISCVSERAALAMGEDSAAQRLDTTGDAAAVNDIQAVAQLVHEACNIVALDPTAVAHQDGASSDGVTKARHMTKAQQDTETDETLADDEGIRAVGIEDIYGQAASAVAVRDDHSESESDTTDAEHREEGAVKCVIWQRFAGAVGWSTSAALLLSLTLMQVSRNGSDVWLSQWTSWSDAHNSTQGDNSTTPCAAKWLSAVVGNGGCSNNYYLDVLIMITVANAVFTAARALLFAWGGLRAARRLHDAMLACVLEAPLAFFDTTPSGRIVNRFSRDQFCVDESLPFQLNIFLAQAFGLAGTITLLCLTVPPTLVLLAALFPVYVWLQRYYRATSRELKRLDSTTRSPIYAHFEATLDGIVTVRAFGKGAVQRAAAHNALVLDHNQRICFCSVAAAQWLGLRLQCIGAAVTSFIALFAALHAAGVLPTWLGASTDSGSSTSAVGLSLAYALPIVGNLNGLIASFTETEKEMVSVERIHEYSRIPVEQQVELEPEIDVQSASAAAADNPEQVTWPLHGAVDMRALTVQYRPGLPPALQAVSLSINACEKVAFVGRTGAGKSSLLLALLRLVPWTEGTIHIDGIDVRRVPLRQLRRRVGVIAQEPVMFSGTVRSNLCFGGDDDDDRRVPLDDAAAWHALELCHLDRFVAQLPHGLDTAVGTGGTGWSLGQQQLLCLGRALLRRSTLLCIDEATAAVDPRTDALIQQTLRSAEECRCATVLTVAHRLSTVMSYDRIAVMEDGRLVECNSPAMLMADPGSALSQLVRDNNNDET